MTITINLCARYEGKRGSGNIAQNSITFIG